MITITPVPEDRCALCRRPFGPGELAVLVTLGPGSEQDAERMRAGLSYSGEARVTHEACSL